MAEVYIVTALPQSIDPLQLSSIDVNRDSADEFYTPEFIEKTVIRSTEAILSLDEEVQWRFIELYQHAFEIGLLPLFYEGQRSFERSLTLYNDYKRGGDIIAAPPGSSYHNYGLAIDCLVYDRSGKGSLPGGTEKLNELNIQWDLGLTWGKSWGDGPHFQFSEKTVEELQAASPEWAAWSSGNDEATIVQEERELVKSWKKEKSEATYWSRNVKWLFPSILGAVAISLIVMSVFAFRDKN